MTWTSVFAALKGAGKLIVSRPGVALAFFIAGLLVALQFAGHGSVPVAPYVAPSTKRAAEMPRVVEQLPVQVLQPTVKQRKRIAEQYQQPGLLTPASAAAANGKSLAEGWAKEVVAEVSIQPAPQGGTALVTIDRQTGETAVVFDPKPDPRISFANRLEVFVGYGKADGPEAWEDMIRAELRWNPVRLRKLGLEFVAGWERTDRGRVYGLVGGTVAWP